MDVGKVLVRRHVEELWNGHDLAVCEELMARAFVAHAPAPFSTTSPGPVDGPEAMRATCTWLWNQFPDVTMTIEAIISGGDLVAALVRAEGTNSGKLNGLLPPSGRRMRYSQTHWFRVRDGQLSEHWATRDDLSAMLQLGVVTPPPAGRTGAPTAGPRPVPARAPLTREPSVRQPCGDRTPGTAHLGRARTVPLVLRRRGRAPAR